MVLAHGLRAAVAAMAVAAVVCVWLIGSCAALESTITAAKHHCCETQQIDDSCATLCNAADADVTAPASVTMVVPPVATRLVGLFSLAEAPPVLTFIRPANHSPPLYLQHAALLI